MAKRRDGGKYIGRWVAFPWGFLGRKDMTPPERSILLAVCARAWGTGEQSWATPEELGTLVNMERATAYRALKSCVEKGFLVKEVRRPENRRPHKKRRSGLPEAAVYRIPEEWWTRSEGETSDPSARPEIGTEAALSPVSLSGPDCLTSGTNQSHFRDHNQNPGSDSMKQLALSSPPVGDLSGQRAHAVGRKQPKERTPGTRVYAKHRAVPLAEDPYPPDDDALAKARGVVAASHPDMSEADVETRAIAHARGLLFSRRLPDTNAGDIAEELGTRMACLFGDMKNVEYYVEVIRQGDANCDVTAILMAVSQVMERHRTGEVDHPGAYFPKVLDTQRILNADMAADLKAARAKARGGAAPPAGGGGGPKD